MRENRGERRSGAIGQGRLRDFRENLVSIFVDNLNQQVDQPFSWNLFKVFGRVRDIYLSTATVHRKIGYAFVRFGTIEEARRMAEKTNDMHIYGWSIRAKMAQNGWKFRKLVNAGGDIRHTKLMEDDKMACMEGCLKKGQSGSYADVLKLGSKFGDLALVDERTLLRKRLDSARLLMLVSPNKLLPKVIKVVDSHRKFSICVETESSQRDILWINDLLDLI
ncbi:hypothetical protein Dsin_019892 [Dipteronia sinensis]|uniref:RRM domain-containing protein n=1 Tax=Dipteronia sinensis TaxID=43782 RepID=A0AAE0A9L2_9ROSI|nr:hypothetical protein Dsin_019892 [Dipteronia sinensis]